ncbi:hypothetical protein D3C81_1800230 [compost metagenome]
MRFLEHHRRVAEVAAPAAIFGGDGHAEQSFAAGLQPGLAVYAAVRVPLRLARGAFALEEAPRTLAEHFVVLTENGTGYFHGTPPLLVMVGAALGARGLTEMMAGRQGGTASPVWGGTRRRGRGGSDYPIRGGVVRDAAPHHSAHRG